MCTAATYKTKNFYFGRTLDYEFLYGDEITVTPRNYPFEFRYMGRTAQNLPDIRCCRGRTSTGRTKYLLPLGPGKYQEITWRFYLHFCILRKICAVLCKCFGLTLVTFMTHSIYQIISGALHLPAPKIWRES